MFCAKCKWVEQRRDRDMKEGRGCWYRPVQVCIQWALGKEQWASTRVWNMQMQRSAAGRASRRRCTCGLCDITWWGWLLSAATAWPIITAWEHHQLIAYASFTSAPSLQGGTLGAGNFLPGLCLSPGSLLGTCVILGKSPNRSESSCLWNTDLPLSAWRADCEMFKEGKAGLWGTLAISLGLGLSGEHACPAVMKSWVSSPAEHKRELRMAVHICNPSQREGQAEGSRSSILNSKTSSKPVWDTWDLALKAAATNTSHSCHLKINSLLWHSKPAPPLNFLDGLPVPWDPSKRPSFFSSLLEFPQEHSGGQ